MAVLPFTAVTTGGVSYDVSFPLHPQTRSGEQVSEMLAAVLDALSECIERGDEVGNGDVLQALAMAAAVRIRMLETDDGPGRRLFHSLTEAACDATSRAAGRAIGRA